MTGLADQGAGQDARNRTPVTPDILLSPASAFADEAGPVRVLDQLAWTGRTLYCIRGLAIADPVVDGHRS